MHYCRNIYIYILHITFISKYTTKYCPLNKGSVQIYNQINPLMKRATISTRSIRRKVYAIK